MANEREVQEKLAILQQLQGEAETLQRRIVELELLSNEYKRTIETLEFFESIEAGVEALMSLGGGIFAYVDIKNCKKILVDVGSGVVIEREVKDAIEFIKKRKSDVEENIQKLTQMLRQVAQQAASIQEELAKLIQKEKEGQNVQNP
ncbi:prefoldin subunit alpha [Archaeoglobales archaeon]|nr:MAG: prefoldin subunit alpha [Archaeoglobales archaeon ex4484_92]RLI83743.1 MAG: prefoldin subunit alpha [Archaeoglobales archaeon]